MKKFLQGLMLLLAFAGHGEVSISVGNLVASQDEQTLRVSLSFDVEARGTNVISGITVDILSSDGQALWSRSWHETPARTHISESWDVQNELPDYFDEHVRVRVTAKVGGQTAEATMVKIPGGSVDYWRKRYNGIWGYCVGDPPDYVLEEGYEKCAYAFDAFWMDMTEVTWGQWKKVEAWGISHGYDFTQNALFDLQPWAYPEKDDHPVEGILGDTAMLWCNARSEMDGKEPLYYADGKVYRKIFDHYVPTSVVLPADMSKAGYRVPMKYEWEYAGRGGLAGMKFPWGDDYSTDKCNCPPYYAKDGAYHPVFQGSSSPVKYFAPNGYGLYDMAGNVGEYIHHACITDDGNGLYCEPEITSYHMGGSYFSMPSKGCFCEESYWAGWVGAGAGLRSICLSEPPTEKSEGAEAVEYSAEFVIDTRIPKIIGWNIVGNGTELEHDSEGNEKEDPCLVAGRFFVLEVQMNEYKRERYPIDCIEVRGSPQGEPAKAEINFDWPMSAEPDANFRLELSGEAQQLPEGPGYHGPYSLTLKVSFTRLKMMAPLLREKKVFFDKYWMDNGSEPNWFVYWNVDGAVKSLSKICQYVSVPRSPGLTRVADFGEALEYWQMGDGWGLSVSGNKDKGIEEHIEIYASSAEGHYWQSGDGGSVKIAGLEFAYPWEYGIYTVASVIAHESQHADNYRKYVNAMKELLVDFESPKSITAEDMMIIHSVDHDFGVDAKGNEGQVFEYSRYQPLKHKYVEDGRSSDTVFCDHMTDEMEQEINETLGRQYGFVLNERRTDTLDVAHRKLRRNPSDDHGPSDVSNYVTYGDDEFVAMLHGVRALFDGTVDESKDWAYPGHQSYLPSGVTRKPEGSDLMPAKSVRMTGGRLLGEADSDVERLFSISNGAIASGVSRETISGKIKSLDYELTFEIAGRAKMQFVGYLTDPQSNVVATASAEVELSPDSPCCRLEFPADEIYASGRKGSYRMFGLVMREFNGIDYELVWSSGELKTEELNVPWQELEIGRGTSTEPDVRFAGAEAFAAEGGALTVCVNGGSAANESSVQLFAAYGTASEKDLDLKNVKVGGKVVKNFKFPFTLMWEAGEIGEKTVEIPLAGDKSVEGEEFFTLQLANAVGQQLGEARICTARIADANSPATLQDAVGSQTVKVSTSGDGKWLPSCADGLNGLNGWHAESPALAVGKKAQLKVTVKGPGYFTFYACVTGMVAETVPTKLRVLSGKTVLQEFSNPSPCTLHGYQFPSGSYPLTFEVVQGSDPAARATVSDFIFFQDAADLAYVGVMAAAADGGFASGAGFYEKGTKATIQATPYPGWAFGGWLAFDGEDLSLVSTSAKLVFAAMSNVTYVALFDKIPYVCGLADPVDGGKVTGRGYCAEGKKVTLKATANKGYVFAGWYEGDVLLSKDVSLVVADPEADVTYLARFVTAEEDKASIGATVADFAFGAAAESGGSTGNATNVMAGVYLAWPVAASALSQPTVAVSGLPSGLKFTAKPITTKVTSGTGAAKVTTIVTNVPPNTIYGAPTAASKTDKKGNVTPSKVKVTVTTAGKSKAVYEIALTVDPLPAWAQGEFSGLASTPEGRLGSASMSVTAAGKVSGKVIVNGTNCTFTASSYDITSKTIGETNLVAVVTGKLGKGAVTGGITVVASGASGSFAGAEMALFRNVWKDKGAEPVPADAQGLYTVKLGAGERGTGYLSLTVDKKGSVKVAGKAPDGTALSASATLVPAVDPEGAAYYFADVFCAPSAYKGGYVAGTVNFLADRTLSGYVEWRSYNPQSTGDYEKGGFGRALDFSGAKYDKKALLPDLGYGTLALSAFGVGEELLITVDKTGKKFVVVNKGDAKLTFSFTQSTGIWKGSYLMWPDPSSTKSVKVSFEGIMVQGEDLKGFGTYDATSSYPVYNKKGEQTGNKSYKYKKSVLVDFIDPNNDI